MKKIRVLGLLAMSAMMLTACIDSMPDMTAEQSDLVSEYAAGLLLKYSSNYDYRLVSDEELAAAIAQEKALEEETMTETAIVQESTEDASEESTEVQPVQEQETQPGTQQQVQQDFTDADADLAMELGIEGGISLRYQSFEICDSYPEHVSGFSGIDAKEGKKLLVLHFDLENPSDEDADCNLYDLSLKLRVNVNQSVSAGVQETPMLPDDMASFVGNIEAGKKADVVAVAQIEEISDDSIEALAIQISSTNGACNVKVR